MVTCKFGITGNYYVYSKEKAAVVEIAALINKSVNSVYYNKKYEVYAIRCKSDAHKEKLKTIFFGTQPCQDQQ